MAAAGANAQEAGSAEAYRFSEVRLGAFAHDAKIAGGREHGADINLEYTSSTLIDPAWTGGLPGWMQFLLHPRAHIGLTPNLSGKTNQAYAGVTWTAMLTQSTFGAADSLEASFLFGPEINDGYHNAPASSRQSLGSNVLFHSAVELAYRVLPKLAVGIYFEHSSNAGFAKHNAGLTDFGARVAFRF